MSLSNAMNVRRGRTDPLRAFQKRCRERLLRMTKQQGNPSVPLFEKITDVENLLCAFQQIKREGGQAPGPDKLRYEDFGNSEAAEMCRAFSECIRAGQYRPGPARTCPIPKKSGGWRELRIANIADRVIAKAVQLELDSIVEPLFVTQSHGFRPNRGVWSLLIELKRLVEIEHRPVLIKADIHKAFDSIPRATLFDHFNEVITDKPFMNLIEVILRGANPERRTGIDQGCAISPTALNVFMNFEHDVPLLSSNYLAWCRYADDLVYTAQTMREGNEILNCVKNRIEQAGLRLKNNCETRNLETEEDLEILGFKTSLNGQVSFQLNDAIFDTFRGNLVEAHKADNPIIMAKTINEGIISQWGPTLPSSDVPSILDRIREINRELGFRESISTSHLRTLWERSWNRWHSQCLRAHLPS